MSFTVTKIRLRSKGKKKTDVFHVHTYTLIYLGEREEGCRGGRAGLSASCR